MPYADPEKNKQYQKEYQKKWREKNKDKVRETQKKSVLNNKESNYKSKKISSWKYAGIKDDNFELVLKEYLTETHCYICFKPFKNRFDKCLDHDHNTGEIRYIACRNCNGNFLRESRKV